MPPTDAPAEPRHEEISKLGRFIQTYSGFLSSFVIGVAGLVATSIWQYRQSQTAARQAESEQKIATTKAENDWRIARADILAKNLNILSAHGPDSVDQRFGVLLSLTRGNILDPELAVSYALELGRDNATYMRGVLESTQSKSYVQLEQAFVLTCLQRYGVQKAVDACKDDKMGDRSDAIAETLSDEITAAVAAGTFGQGPMTLLRDEHEVQGAAQKLSWMFDPYLRDLYERRQWQDIARFEAFSPGAHLVSALVLATSRTGALVTSSEEAQLDKFHADHRHWLIDHMFGSTCEPECRGKLVQAMLTGYGEAQGDYDEALQRLLLSPRGENGPAVAAIHARLLWCQIDPGYVVLLRDHVLVPTLTQAAANPKLDTAVVEDVAALVALTPEPVPAPANTDDGGQAQKAIAAWKTMLTALGKRGEKVVKSYETRRASAKRERVTPPPMMKKLSFCTAPDVANPQSDAASGDNQ